MTTPLANILVIIPAYQPDERLKDLVLKLEHVGFSKILVVNDGSDSKAVFTSLEEATVCKVVHHAVNLGKGRALKSAFNYALNHYSEVDGVVTVDADGQHSPEDTAQVACHIEKDKGHLVLGVRRFGKSVPLRSLVGNMVTRYVFLGIVGKKISDTQTGLRGIPMQLLPQFLKLSGEKYDYELNMLLATKQEDIEVEEVSIETIYLDDNSSSHFNPLIDSAKIYFLLIRFGISSIITTIFDYIVFLVVYGMTSAVLPSLVVARLCASVVNFLVNRQFVFHSSKMIKKALIEYYLLLGVTAFLSYLIIDEIHGLGVPVVIAKIFAELGLFIITFTIQRDYIFTSKEA